MVLLFQWGARALESAEGESPVWDETMHLDYGYGFSLHGPTFDAADHPYPIVALFTLPLTLGSSVTDRTGFLIPEDTSNLIPARAINLCLGALGILLIALAVGRLTRANYGFLTFCLGTLDPSWMGQARYVTTDLAFGLFFVMTGLGVALYMKERRLKWLLGAGAMTGLALSSKFSGLLLPPLVGGVIFLQQTVLLKQGFGKGVREAARVSGILLLCGFLVLFSVFELHWLFGTTSFLDGPTHWLKGLDRFTEIRDAGRGAFLLGAYSPSGFVGFFPILLVTKTPIVLLLLSVIGATHRRATELEQPQGILLLMGALFLLASILSFVNLGYRHLTPLFPIGWVLGAFGLMKLKDYLGSKRAWAWAVPFALFLEVLGGHPHYLPWTNAFGGGTEEAHHIAVDSSTDWGQDLPGVRRFLHQEGSNELPHMAYFGTANPLHYGIKSVWRPCGTLGRPPVPGQPRAGCRSPSELFLISASCLAGVTGNPSTKLPDKDPCYEWLQDRNPDHVIGGSILVFRNVP